MEPTPTGESSIVREAREGHLERLSRELDTARPEMIITLGNAALGSSASWWRSTRATPGRASLSPAMEPKYGRGSVHDRSDGSLWCTPAPASEYRNGGRSTCVGWSEPMTGFGRNDLLMIGFEGLCHSSASTLG